MQMPTISASLGHDACHVGAYLILQMMPPAVVAGPVGMNVFGSQRHFGNTFRKSRSTSFAGYFPMTFKLRILFRSIHIRNSG